MNPISGADLAAVCADQLNKEALELEVGGPVVYSHKEVAELAFASLGKPARITHVPLWVARFAKRSIRLLPEKHYGSIAFFLTALSQSMVADRYGKDSLEAFYLELAKAYSNPSKNVV